MKYATLIVLAVMMACDGFAQAKRRVLLEEFTNSGSILANETDPMLENAEMDNFDDVIILKWHVSWPYDTDPFYTQYPNAEDRAKKLYGIEYNPYVCLDGSPLGGFGVLQQYDKQTLYNEIAKKRTTDSPYEITISQERVVDSIISLVSVKCVGTPISGELRLGVAIVERYNPYIGTNGSRYVRNVVRTLLPGLNSNGEIDVSSTYPALTIANGETKTIRYACLINTSWSVDQLISVAFIQDAFTNEVYNANSSLPITIQTAQERVVYAPSDSSLNITFTNTTDSPLGLRAELSAAAIPPDWNVFLSGTLSDGSFAVPAKSSATISLRSNAAINKLGYYPFSLAITTLNDMYLGTYTGIAWGKENKDILVDAGAGNDKMNVLHTNMLPSGDYKTVIIDYQTLLRHFTSWNDFRTILIHTGNTFGIHPYDATWSLIKDFQTSGGNVLITSNDRNNLVGNYYDAMQDPNNPSEFVDLMDSQLRECLHLEPAAFVGNTSWSELHGITGDELSSGFTSSVIGRTGTQELIPIDNAASTLKNEDGAVVGTRVRSESGKLVYLPFGIDNINVLDRAPLTKRIMDWFAGVGNVYVSRPLQIHSVTSYPNPAREHITIEYDVHDRQPVTLTIHDILGKEIAQVYSNAMHDVGDYELNYDISELSCGTYIIQMLCGQKLRTCQFTINK